MILQTEVEGNVWDTGGYLHVPCMQSKVAPVYVLISMDEFSLIVTLNVEECILQLPFFECRGPADYFVNTQRDQKYIL